MSINNEIGRLESSKRDIKNAIERRGVPVPESERLDRYAQHIREIQTGEMGPPPKLVGTTYEYQVSRSGTQTPQGPWSKDRPDLPPGLHMWTRVTQDYGASGVSVFYQVDYRPYGSTLIDGYDAGVANSLVQEYSLGDHLTPEQSEDIRSGRFELVRVGGYWTINGRKYWAAHADYRYRIGRYPDVVTDHHMLVIPDVPIAPKSINSANISTGGYANSQMFTEHLNSILKIIRSDFGYEHILKHSLLVSNAFSTSTNASSGSAWIADRFVDLMNERMVFGSSVNSSCTSYEHDSGTDAYQLSLFRNMPGTISAGGNFYWLRDIHGNGLFCAVNGSGNPDWTNAAAAYGVRPAFLVY